MRCIVIDLEATCWPDMHRLHRQEVIEIGAVKLATPDGPIVDAFSAIVRPQEHPALDPFCTELTGIEQCDIDSADPFPIVFPRLMNWIGVDDFVWCSWGQPDLALLRIECQRHRLRFPVRLANHINLKREHARLRDCRPLTMRQMLRIEGLPLTGRRHRALDDARNVATVAVSLLPKLVPAIVPT